MAEGLRVREKFRTLLLGGTVVVFRCFRTVSYLRDINT